MRNELPDRPYSDLSNDNGASQNMTWIDSLRVIGDRHSDCDYAVDTFDGETGTQRGVFDSDSPIGHRIAVVSGRALVVRQILDNCAAEEQRVAFEERCVSLNLDTLARENSPCP